MEFWRIIGKEYGYMQNLFWECEITPSTLYLDAAAARHAALLFPFKEKEKE